MSDNKRNLPTLMGSREEILDSFDRTKQALSTADPISGFFHGLSTRAITRALDTETARWNALSRNLAAHGGAMREAIALRNTIDDWRAREELADRHYELAKARAHARIDQELAQLSEQTAMSRQRAEYAKTNLKRERRVRPKVLELAATRKDASIEEVRAVLPEEEQPASSQAFRSGNVIDQLMQLYVEGQQRLREFIGKGIETEERRKLEEALAGVREVLRTAGKEV